MEWGTTGRGSTPGRYTRTAAEPTQARLSKRKYEDSYPVTCHPVKDTAKQKERTTPPNQQPRQQQQRNTFIMLFSLFLSTLLILLSPSATARPLGLTPSEDHQSMRRAASLSPPPAAHFPGQPYHSDSAAPGRESFPPPYSSGTIDAPTHRSFKRFIMDADYAAGSSSPPFMGKSSRKRADSLSDLTGSTTVGYKDFHEEFPPKLPSRSSSA